MTFARLRRDSVLQDGTSLQLTSAMAANETATSTFFEIKGVLRPTTVALCTVDGRKPPSVGASEGSYTLGAVSYSATTLTQTVTVNMNQAAAAVCVELTSPFGMVPFEQPTGLGGYVGRRMRAHKLKALLDNELHNPQQVAMPLVFAINSATRIEAAARRGDGAAITAELENFDANMRNALTALVSGSLTGQSILSAGFLELAKHWLMAYNETA